MQSVGYHIKGGAELSASSLLLEFCFNSESYWIPCGGKKTQNQVTTCVQGRQEAQTTRGWEYLSSAEIGKGFGLNLLLNDSFWGD